MRTQLISLRKHKVSKFLSSEANHRKPGTTKHMIPVSSFLDSQPGLAFDPNNYQKFIAQALDEIADLAIQFMQLRTDESNVPDIPESDALGSLTLQSNSSRNLFRPVAMNELDIPTISGSSFLFPTLYPREEERAPVSENNDSVFLFRYEPVSSEPLAWDDFARNVLETLRNICQSEACNIQQTTLIESIEKLVHIAERLSQTKKKT